MSVCTHWISRGVRNSHWVFVRILRTVLICRRSVARWSRLAEASSGGIHVAKITQGRSWGEMCMRHKLFVLPRLTTQIINLHFEHFLWTWALVITMNLLLTGELFDEESSFRWLADVAESGIGSRCRKLASSLHEVFHLFRAKTMTDCRSRPNLCT